MRFCNFQGSAALKVLHAVWSLRLLTLVHVWNAAHSVSRSICCSACCVVPASGSSFCLESHTHTTQVMLVFVSRLCFLLFKACLISVHVDMHAKIAKLSTSFVTKRTRLAFAQNTSYRNCLSSSWQHNVTT